MVSMVPQGRAQTQVVCRQHLLTQLAIYYNQQFPFPPVLVAHGLEQSRKLETIEALLSTNQINHAVVKTKDCLSQRHLLTKIFATCVRQLNETENADRYDRIDSLNALIVNLQKLFELTNDKFVLVIDGIDRQRGTSPTLQPALARLGDLIPNLSLIMTSSSSRSISLHRSGIPFVHFPPYNRAEMITMLLREQVPMPRSTPDDFSAIPESQLSNIYKSFITTVYDTLTTHTSSTSFQTYRRTCNTLWPRFIWPMLSGATPQKRQNLTHASTLQWDFARLLSHNRTLFQREGEKALLSRLTTNPEETITFDDLLLKHNSQSSDSQQAPKSPEPRQETPLLKSFSALLLVASYLASHTPQKHDIILFSRLSSSSTNKRKYLSSALSKSRTSSGVRKTPTKKKLSTSATTTNDRAGDETPSRKPKATDTEGLAGEKTPKSTRLLLEKTSHIPRPFALERVIAILRAIHPEGLSRSKGAADKVYAEMSELERLRLVVRCAGDGGARGGGDDGILEEKWRVNAGREFVVGVGRYYGVGLEGWEID